MAFLDHIDPGNSGGSVPTPASPFGKFVSRPAEYFCTECDQSFGSIELMRDHRLQSHPLKRPYLLINGRLCKSEELIHHPLGQHSLLFENTLAASLDGVEYDDIDELKHRLLAKQIGRRKLELYFKTYSVAVDLLFDIIPEADLQSVEECFYSTFDSDELSANHLKRFYNQIKAKGLNGNSYAGGLGCYLSGVLAKDRSPDVGLDYEDFPAKFGEAEDKLTYINRPLAQTIIFAIQFSRNCFVAQGSLVNAPALQSAISFMQTGQFNDVPQLQAEPWSKIPIDAVTELLLAFCSRGDAYRKETLEELEQLIKQGRIGRNDGVKLTFLLMVYCLDIRDFQKARRLFRTIEFDQVLGELAAKLMGSNK